MEHWGTTSAARSILSTLGLLGILLGAPAPALGAPAPGFPLESSQASPVTGAVTISASAVTPEPGLIGIQFKIDGYVLEALDTTSPFQVVWSAASATDGDYTITAEARYASGDIIESAPLPLTVANPPTFNRALYVDATNGNNGFDGLGPSTAWQTLGKANGAVQPGDTVLLRGTFSGQTINPNVSGAADRPIRFKSAPGQTAVLSGGSTAVSLSGKSYIIFDGVSVQNPSYEAFYLNSAHHIVVRNSTMINIGTAYGSWGHAFELVQSSDNLIEGNTITNVGSRDSNSGDSVWLRTASNRNRFLNNTIKDGGHSLFQVASQQSTAPVVDTVIARNILSNTFTTPIILAGGVGESLRTLIEYNQISDSGLGSTAGVYGPRPGIQIQARDNIIRYNEILNNSGAGIGLYAYIFTWSGGNVLQESIGNQIYHNVFYGNNRVDQLDYPVGTIQIVNKNGLNTRDNFIGNNIFYGNRGGVSGGTYYTITVDQYHNDCNVWPAGSLNGNRIENNILLRQGGTPGELMTYFVRTACGGSNRSYTLAGLQSTFSTVKNNLEANPLFVNEASRDFHLQSGSAAIDAGLVMTGIPFHGDAPDLGAYETGAGAPPDTTAPSVPSGLAASAVSSTQINVSWSASTDDVGVTGYRIFRGATEIGTTTSTAFQNTGLSPSTTYTYTVAAYDTAGNASAQSAAVSATTSAPVQSPFLGSPFAVPGLIQAENFDKGGEGVAYHDNVGGNAGGFYRTTEDVDIVSDGGTGYKVNNFETGEWLEYTINVLTTGTYRIHVRVASMFTTSRYHAEIDGVNVTGSVAVPNTGTWNTFREVGVGGINVRAGQHILRIVADQQYFDLKSIKLSLQQSPYKGTPFVVPGTIEAEDFDVGGEGVAYHDNVAGNAGGLYRTGESVDIVRDGGTGYKVNNFETGEWMEYTIRVATSGRYRLEAQAASMFSNSAFHMEIDGVNVTGTVPVPNTGGWNTFRDVGVTGISLSAGQHVLRIVSNQQYLDLNSMRISTDSDTQAPSAPTGLTASAVSPTQINLSWAASSDNVGVTGYQIYRCSGPGCSPALLTSVGDVISRSDTGLSASTLYRYQVSAVDAAGNESGKLPVAETNTLAPSTTTPSPPPSGTTVSLSPQDTFININTDKNSAATILTLYTWPDNKVANAILMKFDLSAIPAGSTIQSATLNLSLTAADAFAEPTYTVTAHKIVNKNPTLAQADGFTYDGATSWTPNTCCYNNIPMAQSDISPAYDSKAIDKTLGVKSFNITQMAREWLNTPSSNFGVLLNSDSSQLKDRFRTFASMEDPDPAKRPALTITYSPPFSGTTLLFSDGFESENMAGWDKTAACDATMNKPRSGSWSQQCDAALYTASFRHNLGTSRHIYLSFWQWFPSGYSWGTDNRAHWFRFFATGWAYQWDPVLWEQGDGTLRAQAGLFYGSGWEHWDWNNPDWSSPMTMADNSWHRVEAYYELNTPGQANGTVKLWYDGNPVFSRTNMQMLPSSFNGHLLDTMPLPSNIGNEDQPGQPVYFDDIELYDGCPAATLYSGAPSCSGSPGLPPPPPPPDSSAGIASLYPGDVGIENHPDVLFVEKFDDTVANIQSRWTDVKGGSNMTLTTDRPAASPDGTSLRIYGGPGGGHLYKNLAAIGKDQNDVMYVRYYVKYPVSANAGGHDGIWMGGYNPPLNWPNPQAGVKPNGSDRFHAAAEDMRDTDTFDHYTYWMGMRPDGAGVHWGNVLLNNPNVKTTLESWMCVEQMVKLNNPVTAMNGENAIWLNGTKVSHLGQGFPKGHWVGGRFYQNPSDTTVFEGFQWRNTANLNLNYIWLQNYSPNTLAELEFDHMVVAKNRIGCIAR